MQRPYTQPLVRSIAAPSGRMVPARSAGVERPQPIEPSGVTLWSAFLGVIGLDGRGPVMSSGPQAGQPTRPALGTAYVTPPQLFNLSGIASAWSFPAKPNPSRQPTAKLAFGKWLTGQGQATALPSLPEPGRMVYPSL